MHLQPHLVATATVAILGIALPASPAWAADPPQAASAPSRQASAPVVAKRHDITTPLRFDPPAAGPKRPTRADYEYCIEHPSFDGLATDCSALLPDIPPKAAKPR